MKPLYTEEEFKNAKSGQKLKLECQQCKRIFLKEKKFIQEKINRNGNFNRFCSTTCAGESKLTFVNCTNCDKIFKKSPFEIKKSKSGNHFCCQSCACTYNNKNKTHGTRRSKLEIWLEEKLSSLYPNLEFHFNRKDTICSELDIYIPSLKLAFELNGIFHYEPIYGSDKLNQIQNNDNNKFQKCIEKGISLCIIDTSGLKYFKEQNCLKYFNLIKNIINPLVI